MGDLIDVTLTNEDVKLVSVEVGIEESVDVDDGLVKLIAWQLLDNSFSQFVIWPKLKVSLFRQFTTLLASRIMCAFGNV